MMYQPDFADAGMPLTPDQSVAIAQVLSSFGKKFRQTKPAVMGLNLVDSVSRPDSAPRRSTL